MMKTLLSDLRTVLPYLPAVVAPGIATLALAVYGGPAGLLAGAALFGVSAFIAWRAQPPSPAGESGLTR